jgi:hypothetical protein
VLGKGQHVRPQLLSQQPHEFHVLQVVAEAIQLEERADADLQAGFAETLSQRRSAGFHFGRQHVEIRSIHGPARIVAALAVLLVLSNDGIPYIG